MEIRRWKRQCEERLEWKRIIEKANNGNETVEKGEERVEWKRITEKANSGNKTVEKTM